ncbi:MAG: hypothetical protein AAFR61_04165 [Bacteroidota bacterium]
MKNLLLIALLYVLVGAYHVGATPEEEGPPPEEILMVIIDEDRFVCIDEDVLCEWEDGLWKMEKNAPTDVILPTWLLQGLEWITHTSHQDPDRTELLTPLYWYMEHQGMLNGINTHRMNPSQIVHLIRCLVDDLKDAPPYIEEDEKDH